MVRSSEIYSIRKTGLNRPHAVVCALFLSLYLGLILPAHHHSDGQEHAGCTLCVSQHQPSIAEIAYSVQIIETFVSDVILTPSHTVAVACCHAYQTRAPPSFIRSNG
jgi:hypothetical protein